MGCTPETRESPRRDSHGLEIPSSIVACIASFAAHGSRKSELDNLRAASSEIRNAIDRHSACFNRSRLIEVRDAPRSSMDGYYEELGGLYEGVEDKSENATKCAFRRLSSRQSSNDVLHLESLATLWRLVIRRPDEPMVLAYSDYCGSPREFALTKPDLVVRKWMSFNCLELGRPSEHFGKPMRVRLHRRE